MAIRPFLAMTAAEMQNSRRISAGICWMACHFSPYGLGLSNLPTALPPGSLLMVDDITPIHGHRPDIIATQLEQAVQELGCAGVLLDFQRSDCAEAAALASSLVTALPCPVAVSDVYAAKLDCPVFLSAPPCNEPPESWFFPWQGREIWLELSQSPVQLTVDKSGCQAAPLPSPPYEEGFADESLLSHYRTEIQEDSAIFTLWRTREDMDALLKLAESFGVTRAVGLYQEFEAGI